MIGKIIGGGVKDKVRIRLEPNANVNIGDVVIVEDGNYKYLMKIIDIYLESQIPEQFVEDMAAKPNKVIFDREERFYKIATAKLLKMEKKKLLPPRDVPGFFKEVREVKKEDLKLKINGEVPIGKLRLGSKVSDIEVSLPAKKLVSHHMLVVAATGKGKSNFAKVFLTGMTKLDGFSAIVFDPHSEYYGDKGNEGLRSLKDVRYFTPRYKNFPGSEPLKIFADDLNPYDFIGVIELSDAQKEAMITLSKMSEKIKKLGEVYPQITNWLSALVYLPAEKLINLTSEKIGKATFLVLKRKLLKALEVDENGDGLVFSMKKRDLPSIFERIDKYIKEGKTVIVDTSMVGEDLERIISSAILNRLFDKYRGLKQRDPEIFSNLPEVLVVFEEAPRVLNNNIGDTNIFERIAREGRKFKIGLCAITQMPSLIPPEILSQLNTKVILGIPSPADRNAVINSSAQDISDETTEVQMLDVGEAIITSPFVEFPLPVKIYKFEDIIKKERTDFII